MPIKPLEILLEQIKEIANYLTFNYSSFSNKPIESTPLFPTIIQNIKGGASYNLVEYIHIVDIFLQQGYQINSKNEKGQNFLTPKLHAPNHFDLILLHKIAQYAKEGKISLETYREYCANSKTRDPRLSGDLYPIVSNTLAELEKAEAQRIKLVHEEELKIHFPNVLASLTSEYTPEPASNLKNPPMSEERKNWHHLAMVCESLRSFMAKEWPYLRTRDGNREIIRYCNSETVTPEDRPSYYIFDTLARISSDLSEDLNKQQQLASTLMRLVVKMEALISKPKSFLASREGRQSLNQRWQLLKGNGLQYELDTLKPIAALEEKQELRKGPAAAP